MVPGETQEVPRWLGLLACRKSGVTMADQLYTAAEAACILKVRESWLKTKAAARSIPCTFIGKHLRFSDGDIVEIMKAGARQPVTARERRPGRGTA
jgi:hypothetical protein